MKRSKFYSEALDGFQSLFGSDHAMVQGITRRLLLLRSDGSCEGVAVNGASVCGNIKQFQCGLGG
jgi:hypothetical protein